MPKLNPEQKQATDEAEDQQFPLMPEGRYLGTLLEVEEREGNEFPYWNCTFGKLVDASGKKWPGKAWDTVSLGPKSAWKVKQFFEALGYSTDSDTDEMIGEQCVLHISQEVAARGKKAGELRNVVDSLAACDPDEWSDAVAAAGVGGDDDDSF